MEVQEYLNEKTTTLLKLLDVNAEVEAINTEDDYYSVNITGEDLGHLIGFKGSVINSLQSFLYSVVRKEYGEGCGIQVNVNNYREKREESLRTMVEDAAKDVERSGKSYRFGSLSPYERRFIHTFVSNKYPDLVTYSVGEGAERRLVLSKSDM